MVAKIATTCLRGADGRTGYERLFGKQVHEEWVLWRKQRRHDMNVIVDA